MRPSSLRGRSVNLLLPPQVSPLTSSDGAILVASSGLGLHGAGRQHV